MFYTFSGPREQINQLSAYLDASMLYGSDECLARNLRENNGQGARMRIFPHPLARSGGQYKALLPRTFEQPECFTSSGECFLAGDLRVNEQPGLTCMHTVLLRQERARTYTAHYTS
jgi:peroxidase